MPARPVGYPPFDEGVQGPGDTLSVATNAFSEGLVFQNMPLGGGSAGDQRAVLSSDHPYNGTVGLVDAGTPLVAFSNGASFTQFRRYDRVGQRQRRGQLDPGGRHRLRRLPAPGRRPDRPVHDRRHRAGALVARKYDGTTFTPGVTIVATGGNDAQQHITQDAAGRLHAVFPRGDAEGLHLGYATSDNGTVWRSGTVLIQPARPWHRRLRAAVAPDHIGVAAWETGSSGTTAEVRVAGIGPDAPVDPRPPTAPGPLPVVNPPSTQPPKPRGRLPRRIASAKRISAAACASRSRASSACRPASAPHGVAAARSSRRCGGKKWIARVKLGLNRSCRFRRVAVLSRKRIKRVRRLGLSMRFGGNAALSPATRGYQ